jgi:hypothetical protein
VGRGAVGEEVAGRVRRSWRGTGRDGVGRVMGVRVMVGVAGVDVGSLADWLMRACWIVGGGREDMIELLGW